MPVESAVSWAAGGTRCPRGGTRWAEPTQHLPFLGCVISDVCRELGAAPRHHASAGRAARPRWWHTGDILTGLSSFSPSPGSGSSARQPSRWAAWPCPWSSQQGTKDGGGAALRHSTRGTAPAPGRAPLLPRGFLGAPPPLPHGLAFAETLMLSLPEAPDPPPDAPLYLSKRSCRDGAAGRAETPPQHPPCNRGLSPQPRACRGEREALHTGTLWLSPAR